MIVVMAYSLNTGDITGRTPAVKRRRFIYSLRKARKNLDADDGRKIAVGASCALVLSQRSDLNQAHDHGDPLPKYGVQPTPLVRYDLELPVTNSSNPGATE
jgi:hypothetical protein